MKIDLWFFLFFSKNGGVHYKKINESCFFFFLQNIVRFIKEVDLKSVSLSLQSV